MLKKAMLLLVVLTMLMSGTVLAAETAIQCEPGDTIEAVFRVTPGSAETALIIGELEYDHDVLEGQFAGLASVSYEGRVHMYNGSELSIPFRVSRYAPAGIYTITLRVVEAKDSQGKTIDDVSILPVEVTVGDEAAAIAEPADVLQQAEAAPVMPEADFRYEIHEEEATVTGYAGYAAEVVIPDTLGGYPVRIIGDDAFAENERLTSVTIPEGVTEIGSNAFGQCFSLQSVQLPSTLQATGHVSFQNCYLLTEIHLPDGLIIIAPETFNGCTGLTSITIPDSVTDFGVNPFCGCTNLREIHISPDHLFLEVKDGVLYNKISRELICYPCGLSQAEFSIPDGIIEIGMEAFEGCRLLTGVTIPDSVMIIESGAFMDCSRLQSISLPNGVLAIEPNTFFWCDSLRHVDLPNSIISIGWDAFRECTSLKSITIPDSVVFMDERAFSECSPDLVITVSAGSYALDYCKEHGLKYEIK